MIFFLTLKSYFIFKFKLEVSLSWKEEKIRILQCSFYDQKNKNDQTITEMVDFNANLAHHGSNLKKFIKSLNDIKKEIKADSSDTNSNKV
jgi:hypothetical protein